MANTTKMDVLGDKELLKALKQLNSKGVRNSIRNTLRKQGTRIAKTARTLAPVDRGDLKKSIRVKSLKGRGLAVIVAPRYGKSKQGKAAPHAHLVEFGTGPRRLARPRQVVLNGQTVTITHTGTMPAQPFMRPAFKRHENDTRKMEADIWDQIEKQAKKGNVKGAR